MGHSVTIVTHGKLDPWPIWPWPAGHTLMSSGRYVIYVAGSPSLVSPALL